MARKLLFVAVNSSLWKVSLLRAWSAAAPHMEELHIISEFVYTPRPFSLHVIGYWLLDLGFELECALWCGWRRPAVKRWGSCFADVFLSVSLVFPAIVLSFFSPLQSSLDTGNKETSQNMWCTLWKMCFDDETSYYFWKFKGRRRSNRGLVTQKTKYTTLILNCATDQIILTVSVHLEQGFSFV